MSDRGKRGLLALAAVWALCCGMPALLVAGGLAAAGGGLGACGSWPAAVILLALAGGLGVRWWTTRRQGGAWRPPSRGVRRVEASPSRSIDASSVGDGERTVAGVDTPHG
jgi:hypothetical protein